MVFMTGSFERFLGVFYDKLFPKYVDMVLGASCNLDTIGRDGGKAYCIAYLLTPKPCIGGDDHGIVLTNLYLP